MQIIGRLLNLNEDLRKYAAGQAISEEDAFKCGMENNSKEFVEAGDDVVAKA